MKVENTRGHGARVVLHGETLAESQEKVAEIVAAEGLVLVHPYDDPLVMAGQGTIALEMLEDRPNLDAIIVPMGGGGLVAGIAVAAKALKPDIRIVGAEAALFPSFHNAMRGASLPIGGPTLAEGIAVKHVGQLTLPVARALVEGPILLEEEVIERAVNAFATLQHAMAEGAGAAGLAALLKEPMLFRAKRSGSCSAAAISTPGCSLPSWCGNLSETTAFSPFGSRPATGRACSGKSRAGSAGSRPTSLRSRTDGSCSTCRRRA